MRLLLVALVALSACESRPLTKDATMPLPFSRERTYTDDVPVDPNDLNAVQDSITAKHNRPIHYLAHSWAAAGKNAKHSQFVLSLNEVDFPGESFEALLDITPDLIPGDTIKEIVWRYYNGATPTAGLVDLTLTRVAVATGASTVVFNNGNADDTDTGGADAARNITTAINHEVLADHFYMLRVTFDGTGAGDGASLSGATVVLEQP